MKTRILKILIPLLIIIFAGVYGLLNQAPSTAFAVGDLTVNWGVPEGNPIFIINNMAPGQMVERNVVITNNASTNRPVGVRGIKVPPELANLSNALTIQIFDGVSSIYGPVNLSQFLTDSGGPVGIPLFTLSPSQTKIIKFKVTFKSSAGNEFQAGRVVFDLKIGIAIAVPVECQGIAFTGNGGNPIFGTQGNDNLTGTPGNDLIFAFEGDDKVEGNSGDDCIVGGPGNDRLNGNNGNDVILGGEGDDTLIGNNGNDTLIGGSGSGDSANGGAGSDTCTAEVKSHCEF